MTMHETRSRVSPKSPGRGGAKLDAPFTADLPLSPASNIATPRHIVTSIGGPPTCVTRMVRLDESQSAHPFMHMPQSISSVDSASEVISGLVEEPAEGSTSSFMAAYRRHPAHRGASPTERVSLGKARSAKPHRASSCGVSTDIQLLSHDNNDSLTLSYSDSSSFFSSESPLASSAVSRASSVNTESGRSVSYTAISESVPSCSLTAFSEHPGIRGAAWPRSRRNGAPPMPHRTSGSFGSLFGEGGMNPYDGKRVRRTASNFSKAKAAPSCGLPLTGTPVAAAARPAAPSVDSSSPKPLKSTRAAVGDEAASGSPTSPSQATRQATPTRADALRTSPHALPVSSSADHQGAAAAAEPAPPPSSADEGTPGLPTNTGAKSSTPRTAAAAAAAGRTGDGSEADDERQWRVLRARKEDRIGRGSYGDVYRGVDLDTGRVIAVKEVVVPKDFTKDLEKQIMTLEREIRVMRKLHHVNIINYLGAERDDNCLNIFMEYVPGGTVGQRLREHGSLTEEQTRYYTLQLLCGLEYLHAQQIVHRDLKGDNLFLTAGDVLKVGDFGTSKELVTTLVTDSVAGTPNFMAPEVIACSGHSYEADIWSVGCCVLEMLTGLPPFASLDNHMAVMFAIMKGRLEEQVPPHISVDARNFIQACTHTNPKSRWVVGQLRQHPWLRGPASPASPAPQRARAEAPTASPPAALESAAPSDPQAQAHAAPSDAASAPSSSPPRRLEQRTTLLDAAALARPAEDFLATDTTAASTMTNTTNNTAAVSKKKNRRRGERDHDVTGNGCSSCTSSQAEDVTRHGAPNKNHSLDNSEPESSVLASALPPPLLLPPISPQSPNNLLSGRRGRSSGAAATSHKERPARPLNAKDLLGVGTSYPQACSSTARIASARRAPVSSRHAMTGTRAAGSGVAPTSSSTQARTGSRGKKKAVLSPRAPRDARTAATPPVGASTGNPRQRALPGGAGKAAPRRAPPGRPVPPSS